MKHRYVLVNVNVLRRWHAMTKRMFVIMVLACLVAAVASLAHAEDDEFGVGTFKLRPTPSHSTRRLRRSCGNPGYS